ncbi:MAG: ATP-binding cassette domain-containing protein, partial [Actinomycetota bacterium]|nr:ATP-binding cassette domain-containing protein [Actinomycetota bacterium]
MAGDGHGGAERPVDLAVQVRDLVKRYPGRPVNAVDGISFTVRRGEVLGLLGPNGAGKTTTIGVLTTRVLPTSGTASVAGVDVAVDPVTARSRLSVVPQRSNLDRALTARQNLVFHAAYHGVGRPERNRRADALWTPPARSPARCRGSATLDIDVERAAEDTDEAVLSALGPLVERVEQIADDIRLRARL